MSSNSPPHDQPADSHTGQASRYESPEDLSYIRRPSRCIDCARLMATRPEHECYRESNEEKCDNCTKKYITCDLIPVDAWMEFENAEMARELYLNTTPPSEELKVKLKTAVDALVHKLDQVLQCDEDWVKEHPAEHIGMILRAVGEEVVWSVNRLTRSIEGLTDIVQDEFRYGDQCRERIKQKEKEEMEKTELQKQMEQEQALARAAAYLDN
ncbi:hypothetical protein F5884DRAFT_320908 [Xylogone sp. PMI_703]|nr:hypothetical protein F5884DRAFT_320908 [Xylogone sp. PMI_703]